MDEKIEEGDRVDEVGGHGRVNGSVVGVSGRGAVKVSWPTDPGGTPYVETHSPADLRVVPRAPAPPIGPTSGRGSA